jgi:predicted dehydrogenase
MKSVGLVGVNTYHAEAFSRIFNGDTDTQPAIEGARITHIWGGEHEERRDELVARFGHDHSVAAPADMIGAVDGVLVVDDTNGGARHSELATPFIEAGLPVFVDKPMTTRLADAIALFDLAERHNAPLLSCSALRFSVELAALREQVSALGRLSSITSVGPEEWFYYGIHAVELVGALTDDRPLTVHRHAMDNKDVAVVTYDTGLVAVIETLRDAGYLFNASVYGEHGHLSFDVEDGMGFYTNTMREFTKMIDTRTSPLRKEQTLDVLAILHAGIRSAETGQTVSISDIMEDAQ